jgi:hypothetical protein
MDKGQLPKTWRVLRLGEDRVQIVLRLDDREEHDEERRSGRQVLLLVAHTEGEERIRIISARRGLERGIFPMRRRSHFEYVNRQLKHSLPNGLTVLMSSRYSGQLRP